MKRGAPARALELLEERLQMPVVVFASSWREDLAVDPDEAAARVLVDHLESVDFLNRPVGLVLIGRGGTLGFCDLVYRAARRAEIHIVVPYLITGRVGLAGLSGASVALGRYGAIGAFDAPGAHHSVRVDHAASRSFTDRVVGTQANTDALSSQRLGTGQGLLSSELVELGIDARELTGDDDAAAWSLYSAYEASLGLRDAPLRRYSESDVGDEVEWEFATGVPGAFIESTNDSTVFLLDTGRPDPDTGRLLGSWRVDDVEQPLELDFENAEPAT